MCVSCWFDKGNGCECTDERMTEEDISKIESGEYYGEKCPFYLVGWVKERNLHMRLIDVDEFLEKEGELIEMQGKEQSYYSVPYLLSKSEVDAIPVRFLLEKMADSVYEGKLSGEAMQEICMIIGEWKKEGKKDETVG